MTRRLPQASSTLLSLLLLLVATMMRFRVVVSTVTTSATTQTAREAEAGSSLSSSSTSSSSSRTAHALRRWIEEAEGGHVHSNVELLPRRVPLHYPSHVSSSPPPPQQQQPSSSWWFAAKGPLRKGEVVAVIPDTHVFQPSSTTDPMTEFPCDMVDAVAQELEQGERSFYAPLFQHLQEMTLDMFPIPSLWSSPSRQLLRQLLSIEEALPDDDHDDDDDDGNGNGDHHRSNHRRPTPDPSGNLPPRDPVEWITHDYLTHCYGDSHNHNQSSFAPSGRSILAAAMTITWKEEGFRIIPLSSLLLHHNGPTYTNVDMGRRRSRSRRNSNHNHNHTDGTTAFHVVALRDIAPGEFLSWSHNLCHQCGQRRQGGYGTAELFRDYGWIEDFPQRWHYMNHDLQFDLSQHATTTTTTTTTTTLYSLEFAVPLWKSKKMEDDVGEITVYLWNQIRRLIKWRNSSHFQRRTANEGGVGSTDEKDPIIIMMGNDFERRQIEDFVHANILAMTLAAKALDEDRLEWPTAEIDSFIQHMTHYHPLTWEFDDLDYKEETCDNDDVMEFPHHTRLEEIHTPYQAMSWMMNPRTGDMLLELDRVVQIASNYRPHYHEYSVHAAARYIPTIQRVIFIGGGDSMLLHEILKYPDLELVVGLELDQTVTRKSFQYFSTQPHFDDPRVEWWFGDATKSLLLLPKDYWRSFDLVLVDLSETVMSMSVTEELDVFDALAMLLQPEGVLVKNEQYFEPLSRVFDYAIQIVYECPVICDQCMIFGSHGVDFLHVPLYDHGIPTLLYEPLVHTNNRLDFLHDYRKNKAPARCKNQTSRMTSTHEKPVTELQEQTRSAGIMEVLDLEQITIDSDSSLATILTEAIVKNGFHSTKPPVVVENVVWILMEEGYLLARSWPTRSYLSMEVHVWARFHTLKDLSKDLAAAFQSGVVSNFRVVVGGMYGSSTWAEEDSLLMGPYSAPPQARHCDENHDPLSSTPSSITVENHPSTQKLIETALQEGIEASIQTQGNIAVVLCGTKEGICMAADSMERWPPAGVSRVIRLEACSELASVESMYDCERLIAVKWIKALRQGDETTDIPTTAKTQLLLVDSSASKEFLQIIESLLSERNFHKQVIATVNVAMAWSTHPTGEEDWRRYFLERYRRHYRHDPLSRGEFIIKGRDGTTLMELGMVVCGNDKASYVLSTAEAALQREFASSAISVSLDVIYGGKYPFLDPWNPKEFLQSDYDNQSGLDQYYSQEPLAHHTVFQLESKSKKNSEAVAVVELDMESLVSMFRQALEKVDMNCLHWEQTGGGGGGGLPREGGVALCIHPTEGTAVLTYDGRSHVDVSYHRIGTDQYSRMKPFQDALVSFRHSEATPSTTATTTDTTTTTTTKKQYSLSVVLQDEMPRGVGRTINAASDLYTPHEVQARLDRLKSGYFRRRRNRHPVEMEDDDEEDEEDSDENQEDDAIRDEL